MASRCQKIKNQEKFMEYIFERYDQLQKQLPQSIDLTVVTKKQTIETILPIINAGHTNFAENYVQEAEEKWSAVLLNHNINLKLIGKLQSNKIDNALKLFNEIHSIYSLELAENITKKITQNTKTKAFYLQVNIGEEEQKSGIRPHDIPEFFAKSSLFITGLMCIPPINIDPSFYFLLMHNIKNEIDSKFHTNLKLSMGMSSDWKIAVKLKTDEIRIGSLIFKQ